MSDKEDATASLRDSEVLSVSNPPGHAIPEFDQASDDSGEVVSLVHFPALSVTHTARRVIDRRPRGKQARDVLRENPAGSKFSNEATELPPQPRPLSTQSRTMPSHGEVLTRPAARENIDSWEVVSSDGANVVIARHVRPVLGEHAAARRVDLYLEGAAHSRSLER